MEIQQSHLDLSELDWRFRRYVQEHGECLQRSTYAALDAPNPLLKYRLQSWPTFVRRARLEELAGLSLALNRLIRSVPQTVLGNDPARISEAYGALSPPLIELLLAPPNGIDLSLSRGDFIDTAGGMKCIEFNFSPSLGGWETAILSALHHSIPATSRFLVESAAEVSCTNTMAILFRHILRAVQDGLRCHDPEIHVAFVVEPGDHTLSMPELPAYLRSEYDPICAERGVCGQVVVCTFRDLWTSQGNLLRGAQRIHCVVNLTGNEISPEAFRCFKRGRLCLLNTPIGVLLTSKVSIALLSEFAEQGAFSPEDCALIRRHVPWTRRVSRREVSFRQERVRLPELLLARQSELVLKLGRAWGGSGVALGKATPGGEWRSLVESALARGGWVVQELVDSRPYLYQSGEEGCSPHDVIWGPFVFGETYAGVILRVQPKAEGRAVNLSLNATEGLVFEV
jgi:hypothetical protein